MTDYKLVPVAITDADILAIAGRVESCPVSPWWLKDDVAIGDVRAAVLRFARALLDAAPAVQGEPDRARLRERFDEIEREIMENKHTASSVFTQMRTAVLYTAPQPAEQQPAPDVEALVEALSIARDYVFSSLEEKKLALAGYPQMWRCEQDDLAMIDAALAAHRKQGG